MTTYEWIGLIVTLIGGFWILTERLARIERTLVSRVSFKECSEKRDSCPCVREFNARLDETFRTK